MSTQVFLKQPANSTSGLTSYFYANPTRSVLASVNSVTNTTSGGTKIQCTASAGGTALKWISAPLANAASISGTITFNIRAKESNASANTGITVDVLRYSD